MPFFDENVRKQKKPRFVRGFLVGRSDLLYVLPPGLGLELIYDGQEPLVNIDLKD